MTYEKLGKSDILASRVSLGLMRIADKSPKEAVKIVKTALDAGINFFDHADIYGRGKSETVFAQAIKTLNIPRDTYYLQSKVGIKPGLAFDFDKDYILKSVDGILERLQTDYLDVLLLHRPDMLWEPEKIAKAFEILKSQGKVRYFGVSNMHQEQMTYLQSKLSFPLIVNQLQFSIMHAHLVSSATFVNMQAPQTGFDASGILDYMRNHHITMQAWSPFMFGKFEGVFIDHDKFPELNQKLAEIAEIYGVTKNAIAVSWINTHPAKIQTIIGTMTPSRIMDCAKGADIILTKEQWYAIYLTAGNKLP